MTAAAARHTFALEVVTPAYAAPPRPVVAVEAPGEAGDLTILAGHQPLVCLLRAGEVRVRNDRDEVERWTVEPGTLIVTPDGVTLLTRQARAAPPPK